MIASTVEDDERHANSLRTELLVHCFSECCLLSQFRKYSLFHLPYIAHRFAAGCALLMLLKRTSLAKTNSYT